VSNAPRTMYKLISIFFAMAILSPRLSNAATPIASDRIVVMISVDGLAAYYIDDPKADMPNIRALADAGARAASMKASTPTVTWPNHTTLVTGDNPARHGVVGNNYFDRTTLKPVVLISDPNFDKDQIVKVPTIYDLAKANGLRTAGIRWPATRNAKSLDWTFPDVASNDLLHQTTTPALLAETQQAGIWEDGKPQNGSDKVEIVSDDMCTAVFDYVLHNHRPQFALLHLIEVDHTEHMAGPKSPQAYAAVKAADAQVGEVWQELQKDFPGKATLVIVSDHGFSPTLHMLTPNIVLRDAGLVEVKGIRVVAGSVRIVTQGGAAFVYVLDEANRSSIIEQVTKAFTGLEGIEKVISSDQFKDYGVADPSVDPHAPDMILFAKEGYAFGDTAGGALPPTAKPERKGSHGHDADLPDLHATFVAWGVGIKSGARLGEIQNIDVAPTLAKLLNISMPDTDGKPLTEALSE
jgi:predicted AlkP superfamily pyrophosphatase or phosphodiesterase